MGKKHASQYANFGWLHKGNSFFRNIKILIKDFDEKVKKTF